MAELSWLPEALQDIGRLHAFLVEASPDAARRLAGALLEGAEQLRAHPHMGRPHGSAYREWLVRFSTAHYVFRYRVVRDDHVVVVRVWHERERR